MRVRMLKTYESKVRHVEHGELTLVYPAGSTQHFETESARLLIADGFAQSYPETSARVRLNRVVQIDGTHYPKGELVHVAVAVAEALLSEMSEVDGRFIPAANIEPDPDADFVASTMAAAHEIAIARKIAADEAEKQRDAAKRLQAAAAGSGNAASTSTPAPTSTDDED